MSLLSYLYTVERFLFNANKLRSKMAEKEITISELSKELRINPSTFYRKMKNNPFEIAEANKISCVLNLSVSEVAAIFLLLTRLVLSDRI